MQEQLKHHIDAVMNNQNHFAIRFLPEFTAVFECVTEFRIGVDTCLIDYDTRFYHGQQRSIKTEDFLEWVKVSAGE